MLIVVSPRLSAEPIGKDITVYHIGNSLTFGLSLERLEKLFASEDGSYAYGTQMGAGIPLNAHLTKIHGYTGRPFKRNTVQSAPYGNDYEEAFKKHTFDAVILQPYSSWLETQDYKTMAENRKKAWNPQDIGDRQAVSEFIRRASAANDQGQPTTERFYLYGTWPRLIGPNPPRGEAVSFADFWERDYDATAPSEAWAVPTRDFQHRLVQHVNEDNPDLKTPVYLIPAGEVLARLDVMIRKDELPGIEDYITRSTVPMTADGQPATTHKGEARSNDEYYRTARQKVDKQTGEAELVKGFPFEGTFDRSFGVQNLYCDLIHMNDQPHAGPADGTLGAYVAALTIYATLTGQSPVGLTTGPWERIDAEQDAELVAAVQEVVWDVVSNHPHTGVSGQPQ